MGRLGCGRRSPWWKRENGGSGCAGKLERVLYPELSVNSQQYDLDTFMAHLIYHQSQLKER